MVTKDQMIHISPTMDLPPEAAVRRFQKDRFSSIGTVDGGSVFIQSVCNQGAWKKYEASSRRCDMSVLRHLAEIGVTAVTLSYSGRVIEFTMDDLLKAKVGA